MKSLAKSLAIPALVGMLGMSAASQAMVVSEGFELGSGLFDSGEVTLAAGDYTLDLEAFTFGPAAPFIFGITNAMESFQVSVAEFGSESTFFSTVGGVFSFLVGGSAGSGEYFVQLYTEESAHLMNTLTMRHATLWESMKQEGKGEPQHFPISYTTSDSASPA